MGSMQLVYIPHLEKAPDQTRVIVFEEKLDALEALTPVKGRLSIQHRGTFLEVKAQAETIMTLTCHRCLQHYNQRIKLETSEMIWLQADVGNEALDLEREVAMDDLVETLSPQGHFDPALWLYEHFCLAIPQRQLCDAKCPGIEIPDQSESTPTEAAEPVVDGRWAMLSKLQQQLLDQN
jgi:uncharacterized protein